jgi:hypothetical protein
MEYDGMFTFLALVMRYQEVKFDTCVSGGLQRNPNNADSGQQGRDSGESTIDSLLKSLKQKGYGHCILYHHVKKTVLV